MENNIEKSNTIVALSTPIGVGAIAVVRLSGYDSIVIACKMLESEDGKNIMPTDLKDRYMKLCTVCVGKVRDKVLAVAFKSPNSYTGENVVEIQTHGNSELAGLVVKESIKNGAKRAESGEFTRRAFLNGKIDLSGAEGIIDLIYAQGEAAMIAAQYSAEGELYKKINKIYDGLIYLAALTESAIDYPEEDLEEITNNKVKNDLNEYYGLLTKLIDGYEGGALIRDGVNVAIAGEPNVGKSTLLNSLIGYDRAIVTDVAGTTRDTIVESYIYKGIRFNICDTAGIRSSDDTVEAKGIERSYVAIKKADIILALSEADKEFNVSLPDGARVMRIKTKSDCKKGEGFCISAKTGENIESLKEKIYKEVKNKVEGGGARINNERQFGAAEEARACIKRALVNVGKISIDCIASDIVLAADNLGKITGKTASADVIDQIFKNFCVGK